MLSVHSGAVVVGVHDETPRPCKIRMVHSQGPTTKDAELTQSNSSVKYLSGVLYANNTLGCVLGLAVAKVQPRGDTDLGGIAIHRSLSSKHGRI